MKNIISIIWIALFCICCADPIQSQTWTQIGPTSIPVVGNVNNGFGQFIHVVLHTQWIEKTATDVVYASQNGGGLWKRTYNAATLKYTWTPKNKGLPAISNIDMIRMDDYNPNHLFINLKHPSDIYHKEYEWGIFESFDGGDNWIPTIFNWTYLNDNNFLSIDFDFKTNPTKTIIIILNEVAPHIIYQELGSQVQPSISYPFSPGIVFNQVKFNPLNKNLLYFIGPTKMYEADITNINSIVWTDIGSNLFSAIQTMAYRKGIQDVKNRLAD